MDIVSSWAEIKGDLGFEIHRVSHLISKTVVDIKKKCGQNVRFEDIVRVLGGEVLHENAFSILTLNYYSFAPYMVGVSLAQCCENARDMHFYGPLCRADYWRKRLKEVTPELIYRKACEALAAKS